MKVHIGVPDFDKHPEKSQTNNTKWRMCVQVEFGYAVHSNTREPYVWFPTYEQLVEIKRALEDCEKINSKNAAINIKMIRE